jgi:hypothetical protein
MADQEEHSSGGEAGEGPVVCPHCLARNAEGADFCFRCQMPLTAHAEIDPMGQIYAQGDTFRKAIGGPPRTIVLVGMWLIFGPALIMEIAILQPTVSGMLHEGANGIDMRSALTAVVLFLGLAGMAVIYAVILYRLTRNFFRFRRVADSSE